MSNKTRKHIWPVSLVMSIAIIGALAAFLVLASNPGPTDAHGPTDHNGRWPACADMMAGQRAIHDNIHINVGPVHGTSDPCPTGTDDTTDDTTDDMTGDVTVESSSTSGSATVELKLAIKLTDDVPVGGAFVLYLEDDYAMPESISAGDVYFVSTPPELVTGNGSRVYATVNPEIETDAHFTADKKDFDIRVSVPDMCANNEAACEGANGLMDGDTVTMVIQKSAGIKNPSEQGIHSVGASVLGSTDPVEGPMYRTDKVYAKDSAPAATAQPKANSVILGMRPATAHEKSEDVGLKTLAKIGLSDVDNSRGYEMTVTGSGFNNGTTAAVHVLHIPGTEPGSDHRNAYLWNALDCDEMNDAIGLTGTDRAAETSSPCVPYGTSLDAAHKTAIDGATFFSSGKGEAALCAAIVRDGTEVGSALVGSDDKVAVTFEVTAPTFGPGQTNHICMVDGEGRASSTDVEDFKLEPSIKVVPSSVNSGDTVNVFAQDFPANTGSFVELKIAGQSLYMTGRSSNSISLASMDGIRSDGSGEVSFKVPGGLEGVLRIDAKWGSVNEDSKITITGGELNVSKTEALPNETLTITGNGFGSQTCIPAANITLDSVPVMVDDESISTSGGCKDSSGVEVSNSGQFVATIVLWQASGTSNPTLIPGTHELSVEDDKGFGADVSITIPEPTVMVTPDVAGPRDYITITGENWPVDNTEGASTDGIKVEVDDGRSRPYTLFADAVGRVSQEHRVYRNVAIPSTVQVKMTHGDVAKVGSFAVPASTIEVSPGEGQPGDMISLTSGNMPVYSEVDYVEIGGTRSTDPGVNTDRDGNVTVEDVLIPGLDPGVYSVVINVKGTIAIGEVSVLAESSAAGAPAELPGAVDNLGDNLVAIFHFDDVGKEWSFYDPRPEFADLNTLTEMVNGEAYWILVSETVDDVVLNNKARSLTCRGADCWNLEVW